MKRKILIILVSLVIIGVLEMPGAAHAQAAMATINAQINQCEQNAVNNELASVQKKTTAAHSVYGQMMQIDAAAYVCLQSIETLLDSLETTPNLGSLSNPFVAALEALAISVATSIIVQMLGAECSQVLNILHTFQRSLTNLFCIPMPKLNLNLGIGGLHIPMAQCHGVNLLGPMLGLSPAGQQPGTWNLWNMRVK